jgi:hypothetical protein
VTPTRGVFGAVFVTGSNVPGVAVNRVNGRLIFTSYGEFLAALGKRSLYGVEMTMMLRWLTVLRAQRRAYFIEPLNTEEPW